MARKMKLINQRIEEQKAAVAAAEARYDIELKKLTQLQDRKRELERAERELLEAFENSDRSLEEVLEFLQTVIYIPKGETDEPKHEFGENKNHEKPRAFGIDLGTTYSCISYVDEISGESVVVDNMEGSSVTPSVVYFEDEENCVVGDVAKECAVLEPENTCEFAKCRMGEDTVAITIGGEDYSPQQIAALILKKLVHDAEWALETMIKDVVITCPVYCGVAQKQAIKDAGEMVGLHVLQVINESAAAALCYVGLSENENKSILVYDLGGYTFEVAILRVTLKEIVAIATDGDHQLGGKNWDDELMNYLEDEFREQTDFDGEFDLEAQQDLRLKAEKAKQRLTGKPKTKVIVQVEGVKASIELTREKFDEITTALLHKTIEKTNDVLEAAKKKGCETVDEIILVGGSCKMPQVKIAVEKVYPDIPIKMSEPNYAVAKGAAICANILLEGMMS